MTRIKLCGLSRACDIETVNQLKPEYIGFVFARKSKRYVTPERAASLKKLLDPEIKAAGVFVDEKPEEVSALIQKGIIDIPQLHGAEGEEYIQKLRSLTDVPVIKAFQIKNREDLLRAESCSADYILLDSGTGSGQVFDWKILSGVTRPYFLAGGLDSENVAKALQKLSPFAVDVSSGIETDGLKDQVKMKIFVEKVRAYC